jgi:hypothetical protein
MEYTFDCSNKEINSFFKYCLQLCNVFLFSSARIVCDLPAVLDSHGFPLLYCTTVHHSTREYP